MDCRRLCSWGVGPCCGRAAGADLRFLGCAGRVSVLRLLGACVPAGGHGFTERGIGEGGGIGGHVPAPVCLMCCRGHVT